MATKRRCAVCGDTTTLNVRLAWERDSDGKRVNVCCLCAESGKVNAESIDNFTTKDTLYGEKAEVQKTVSGTMASFYRGQSNFARVNRRRLTTDLVNEIYETLGRIMDRCEELDLDFMSISDMSLYFNRWSRENIMDTLKSFGNDYNEREAYVRDFFKEVHIAEIKIEEMTNTYL